MKPIEIWERAVPLAQAYVHFAPPDEAQRFRALLDQVSMPKVLDRLQKRMADGERDPGVLSRSLGPTADRTALEDTLKARCLGYIRSGKLKAFGFAVPRKPDDPPVEVPDYLWQGFIRWDRSSLEAHGLRLEGVRLIPPSWIERRTAELASRDSAPRRGRPSRRDQIIEAYDALEKAGHIDHAQPLKQAARQVREWALLTYPDDDDKGLGEQAIANVIGARFRAGKARPKTIKSD